MTGPVLCAIDINRPEIHREILKTAARLAAGEGVGLDVIAVMPDFGMSVVSGYFKEGFHEKMEADARATLKAFVADTLGSEADSKVRHVLAMGRAYQQILKTAQEAGSGLIVIGAHKPEFRDYLLGPNAAQIVRHSTCSVYVVR